MEFVEIDRAELQDAIEIAFGGDTGLLEKYHIKQGTLAECVDDTYNKICNAEANFPMEYYKVVLDGIKIGYTAMSKKESLLYSFGININYRNKKTLQLWFENVVNILGSFNCYIWTKNERAILHLVKQGMKIKPIDYVQLTYTQCP